MKLKRGSSGQTKWMELVGIMEWQPIKTAPRDGSAILLFLKKPLKYYEWPDGTVSLAELRVLIGWYDHSGFSNESDWECCGMKSETIDSYGGSAAFPIRVEPTHWMPLPKPPETTDD